MNLRMKTAAAVSAAVLAMWAGAFSASAVDNEPADAENTEIIVTDSEIKPVLEGTGDVVINSTNFPNETFRTYVAGFDTDGNGSLSQSELDAVTEIDVSGTWYDPGTIADLTGIEHFTKLAILYCSYNQLTSLDLSNNTELYWLYSSDNTFSIGDVIGSYSLANLPGFVPEKASDWTGAECDRSAKSLKNFTSKTVTYNYDCGNGHTAEFKLVANSYTKLDPPSFEVKGVFGGRNVTFNCNTPGATIYYTTEGRSTLKLTDPHIDPGDTVLFTAYYGTMYARAYCDGQWSNPARLVLKIPKVNTPTITKLDNGKYKIKTTTPGTIVYYTIDGTTPSATNYKGKFWTSHDVYIPAGKTVTAIAVRNCFSDSDVVTAKT